MSPNGPVSASNVLLSSEATASLLALPAPNSTQFRVLAGMNRLGKHVYGGTVSPKEIARRRAANRVARVSRRINRAGA